MSNKNRSQAKEILDHLMEGWTLTALQALENYQCFRLAARIHELRKQGHPIEEKIVTRNGKRYAEYYIPTFKLQYA
jgi:DNA-binding HxlR family transcriptional regulator